MFLKTISSSTGPVSMVRRSWAMKFGGKLPCMILNDAVWLVVWKFSVCSVYSDFWQSTRLSSDLRKNTPKLMLTRSLLVLVLPQVACASNLHIERIWCMDISVPMRLLLSFGYIKVAISGHFLHQNLLKQAQVCCCGLSE